MINEKGILVIATKYAYYGRLAYNLAVSIKAEERDTPICIAATKIGISHLSDEQKRVFDFIIELDDAEDEIGCGIKLKSYDLSPFDKTLYIDADNVWMPSQKPSLLFNELNGVKFTAITEGYHDIDEKRHDIRPDYFLWADPLDIINEYGLKKGKLYQWRSEVMYFEKDLFIKGFFDTAKDIFYNPRVAFVEFGGNMPDELPINISANIHEIEPHKFRWNPAYWDKSNRHRVHDAGYLKAHYWLLSTGGNYSSPNLQKIYSNIVASACKKLGVQHLFYLQPKRKIMKERQKI